MRGKRYSVLGPFCLNGGFRDWCVKEGSFTATSFLEALEKHVLPHMHAYPGPRSVLVLDRCRIHRNVDVLEACEKRGIILRFLPPYCPDLNPIEDAFRAAKTWIRKNSMDPEVRSMQGEDVVKLALASVTAAATRVAFRNNGPYI